MISLLYINSRSTNITTSITIIIVFTPDSSSQLSTLINSIHPQLSTTTKIANIFTQFNLDQKIRRRNINMMNR
uniref:Uncharacterized protein n=1 Tax=Rhizophagus irregularis (strain DAOM 181602 / DAOM 197198 / MUCL 43194) TaxID=747089 RepID=U9URZ3_RHIID